MPLNLLDPDLTISLEPDVYAPRAARYCVRQLDSPSPDLRDAVVLLTSELVTRAVQRRKHRANALIELRVWMPRDIVRVELQGPYELLCVSRERREPPDDLPLLDQVADRWSIDANRRFACIWFEIDRHEDRAERDPEHEAQAEAARWSGRRAAAATRS